MLDFHHRPSRLLLVRAGFRVPNTVDNNLKFLINIYKYEYLTVNFKFYLPRLNIYFANQTVGILLSISVPCSIK